MHLVNGFNLPYEDYFEKFNQNIRLFGLNSRTEALKYVHSFCTVIDIGAHVGISVDHWSTLFQQVHAFEPMPAHYECLIKNTKNLSNVQCYNFALGDKTGSRQGTYRTSKNTGTFQMIDENFGRHQSCAVLHDIQCHKLDEFTFSNVDFIKIDVEGWEFEVLKGAMNTIRTHKPVMMVEYTGGNHPKSLHTYDNDQYLKLIQELDYESVADFDGDTIYLPRSTIDLQSL